MRHSFYTLIGPIGIAQHGVSLAIFIQHQAHWLVGHQFDFVMQGLGQKIGPATIDHHHTITGDNEAEVIVVARIVIAWRCCGANCGKYARNKLNWFRIEHGAGILIRNIFTGQSGAGQEAAGEKRFYHSMSPQ